MTAKKGSQFPWKGDLARPIVWTGPCSRNLTPTAARTKPPTKEEQERHAQRYDAALLAAESEVLRKLELVKKKLRIAKGPAEDLNLAVALATIYVPGFRVIHRGQGRGRKRSKWTDFRCLALIIEVDAIKSRLETEEDMQALREIVRRTNFYIEYEREKNPMPRTKMAIDAAATSLNARLVEARKRASAERFEPFLTPAGRKIFQCLLDAPRHKVDASEFLDANFD